MLPLLYRKGWETSGLLDGRMILHFFQKYEYDLMIKITAQKAWAKMKS